MIALFNYNGSPIQFEEINGQIMANATLMCQAFGKRPSNWLKTEQTQRYISALTKAPKRALVDLQVVKKGGMESGTWIDQKLVLNLARWLDVEFEIWCDERIAELSRNGHVSLDGSVPSAELAEIKQQLAELKALLEQRTGRQRRLSGGTPTMSQQEQDQIMHFWDALNENRPFLIRKEHWHTDHEYLYLRLPILLPYYESYCRAHGLDHISTPALKDILTSASYTPHVASTQKGSHTTYKKAGFGRCHRFRWEVRDKDLYIGEKKVTFACLQ